MKQLLLFVMTLLPMMVNANDLSDNGIYYKIKSDGSLEVMGSSTANVDIPSSITISGTKYRVTSIGAYAFEGRSDITYLSIPYSIKSIGEYAFMGCGSSMTVNIADPESWCNMQLGNEHASPLSSAGKMLVHDIETDRIDIPEEVTSIGAFTFYQCSCLKSLSIPGTVTSIGSSAFEDCDYLTSLSLGEGLLSIGGSAFEGCKRLTNLVLPSTVNSILMNAFKNCVGLTDVYCFAANVPSTDNSAFTSVATENVALHVPDNAANAYKSTWPWSNFKGSIDMSKSRTIHVGVAGTLSNYIPTGEIQYVEELTLTGYLNGTDIAFIRRMAGAPLNYYSGKIYERAERGQIYGKLAVLDISDATIVSGGDSYYNLWWVDDGNDLNAFIREEYSTSDNTISEDMFRDCKFTKVSLPKNLMEIGSSAFSNCESLTSIDIPQSVTSIGFGAFSGCSGLTSIKVESGNQTYDSRNECNAIIEKSSNTLIAGCKNTIIPSSVISIGQFAFSGCSSLTSVTIPNSVTSIGYYAFHGCSSLTSVTIPNSVTSIGRYAFYDCSGLTSVTIGNSVTSIGRSAFSGCSSLTSVTIPNSVTSIGDDAFSGCSGLTSVTIPNSVTYIGSGVFADCSNLATITVDAGNTVYNSPDGSNAIIETTSNKLVVGCKNTTIPNSVTSIGEYAFSDCSGLTSVTIPNSVTSIGEYAFSDCSGLTSVTIPNSVTSIGRYAFYDCSGLTSVTIPNSVTSIGYGAFYDCEGLTSVTSLISTPISLNENIFSNYNIPLYVPSESVEAYKATEPWSNFSSILAIDSTPSQNVGDTFKAQTKEGVWMTFKITSLEPKTCQVGDGENASIDVATVGKVTIPETANGFKVTAIGSKGFYNCSKLTAIYLSENIESIGDQAFYGCTSLTVLDIPRSVKVISNTAFDNCGGSSGITINVSADNTSVIPNNNKVKVNITKPTEETTISLERVFIPKSVKNIGERSFSYCKSVIRMEVEEGHTIFDSRENCNAIIGTATNTLLFGCQNTVIPETVTSIGAYAFEGHSNLKTITIPSGISSIGVNAFGSCEGLTNVISEIESPFAINDNTFDAQTYETAQLTVPCGTKEKYQNAAGWKNFINIVETDSEPGSVKTVDIAKAGTLANYISDSEKYTLTELKVTGYLNSTDFKLLRDMAGNNYLGEETAGKLLKLDLDGATIVKGGENYLEAQWVYYTSGYGTSTSGNALAIENDNELGKDVFKGCKLQEVILPSSLTSIARSAFSYCLQLTNVTLPEGLLSIGESVFLECEALSTLTIPSSVTTLGRYAFAYCNSLTSMTIPDGITTLEDNLFYDCRGLSSVVIPASVTSLKDQVFELCSSLTGVTVYRSAPPSTGYQSFTTQANATLYVPKGCIDAYKAVEPWNEFKEILPIEEDSESVLTYVFDTDNKTAAVTGITEGYTGAVIIPSNVIHDGESYTVTEIDEDAFYRCIGLTSVTIPNSVTSIGEHAFWDCKGLTSITIPNSVTSIGKHAFRGCIGLTSVTIPSSVTSIESYAFFECTGLTSVTIPNSVTYIGSRVFADCSNLATITVDAGNTVYNSPDGSNAIIETMSNTLVAGCKNTTIPNSVASIGDDAFYGCSGLTSVTIPSSVTYIGSRVFAYCSNLVTITVDAGNTVYNSPDDSNAIIETTSNTLVVGCKNTTIPNSVTSIGDNAFYGCNGLTSVTIPNSVTSIGDDAFYECSGLTSVTISNSVTSIGDDAFKYCRGLTSVTIPNSVTSIGDDAFWDCSGLTSVTIPNSVTSIGRNTFRYCSGLTSVTIPNSVKTIGEYAFRGCVRLTSVTIPNSVRTIGEYAFSGCGALTSVTSLISTPISLNENTFSNYNIPLYVPSESVEAYRAMKPWNEFKEIIPIYLTPIEKEVDYSGESSTVDENTDLGGTVIDNVYYNISSDNGGFDADEKCLVVNKAMSDEEIEEVFGKDLFSDDVKENFTGIVIMAPAGKGKVAIDAQTTGGMTLMVKVGAADPIEMELEGKLKMKFPYDVTEPTYVYIYAGQNAAARTRTAEEPSLKIYGISLEMDILKGDANGDGVVNDADVKDVASHIMGKTPKGFNKDAADVNNDNKVNAADIVLINKMR